MTDALNDLRKWLSSLDDVSLNALLAISDVLRSGARVARKKNAGSFARRDALAARAWILKAPLPALSSVAHSAVPVAANLLVEYHGFPVADVERPSAEALRKMLLALGRPLGRLILFALLTGEFPASKLAVKARDDLERELYRADRPKFPHDLGQDWQRRRSDAVESVTDATSHNDRDPATGVDPTGIAEGGVAEAERHLAEFRDRSLAAAGELRSSADRVETGLPITEELSQKIELYSEKRAALFKAVREFATAADEVGVDEVGHLIAEARIEIGNQRLAAQAAADEAARLDKQIEELMKIIDSSGPDTSALLLPGLEALRGERMRLAGSSPLAPLPLLVEERKVSDELREKAATEDAVSADGSAGIAVGDPSDAPTAAAEMQDDSADPAVDRAHGPQPADEIPAAAENTGEIEVHGPPVTSDAAELEQNFPWDEGEPPLAVQLVSTGRLAEAYWVTAVSGEPSARAAVLRFASAAYAVRNTADATAILAAIDFDARSLDRDRDAAVLATTAMLRAGFFAGWSHRLLGELAADNGLPQRWADLIKACVMALRRNYHFDARVGIPIFESDGNEARSELGRRAAALAAEIPRHKTSYQRATRVLQRMMATDQPLANALKAVVDWAEGKDDGALALAVDELAAPESPEMLIERADREMRTPRQAKEPIFATALRTLVRAVNDVRTVVAEAAVLDRRLTTADIGTGTSDAELATALMAVAEAASPPGMAGAAVVLLRAWLQNPDSVVTSTGLAGVPAAGVPGGIAEPTTDVLLGLTDLPYDEEGRPDHADPRISSILAGLVKPFDVAEAVRIYCSRGDLRRARRIIDLADRGVWPISGTVADLDEAVAAATARWTTTYRREVSRARDLFARVRTQNLLDQTEENVVARQLEAMAMPHDPNFDIASWQLRQLSDLLKKKQQDRIAELRGELDAQRAPKADHDSVLALLADGDTVTATEFLSFIRAGAPLPVPPRPTARDIENFTDLLLRGADRGLTDVHASARAWSAFTSENKPLAEVGAVGVEAWDGLNNASHHAGNRLASAVKEILRTLGLRCESRPREVSQRGTRGFRRFRVQGLPSDGSYISVLGSAATDYTVTVVMEERRGSRSVLDVLGQEDGGRANIILYLFTMDLQTRRNLATQATRGQAQALVIDPAVLGWVAATAPGSWRATQRVTLPWTALNPYRPFVAGLVPPEVFVGRDREIAEVIDPLGGLFVYGGRQLGKSALLRRVEATYSDEFQHAVYLDLKGRGIGEAEPASRVWRELVVELKERGVLEPKVSDDAPADVVVTQIRRWIGAHPARRLLLLADEADAFLTADSRGVATAGGVAHFPNVLRLKELMESTQRRFKVVFAGLHQVQRFGHLPNVPLTHGGPDILIGPLEPQDASRLVTEPMGALGYSFERPELVWRLLSATNYQASLIQIFCEELVRTLHAQLEQSPAAPVPVTVTEDAVEAVTAGDRVRSQIAERLRITINLDDRYRVLTLIIALASVKDFFGADYGPEELLEQARERWPAGFEDLTAKQVSIHLNEMVDLGLLIRLSGRNRYAVRSPNVVNMLGTAADLERELREADFDLPYEYNPLEARRLLLTSHGRERRSPLTDGQLALLTEKDAVSVITGTEALGVERAPDALRDYAELRGSKVEVHRTAPDVAKAVSSAARRTRPTVLIADLREAPVGEIETVAKRLTKAPLTAVLLVAPPQADFAAELLDSAWVRPDRWTVSSVRSWPECPFDVLSSRADLISATGGWPELVEEVMAMIMTRGVTKQQALERISRLFDDHEKARIQLAAAGLDDMLLTRVGPWADYFEPGEAISPADAAAALELDLTSTGSLLKTLADLGVLDETGEGVVLDSVVHRCISTVRGEP